MYGEFVQGTTRISFISKFSNFPEEEAILEFKYPFPALLRVSGLAEC